MRLKFSRTGLKTVASAILAVVEPGLQPGGNGVIMAKRSGGMGPCRPREGFSGRQDAALYGRLGSLPLFSHALCWLTLLMLGVAPALAATNEVVATGITEPYLQVTLSAPVPGIVTVRHFQEGDHVKEGQAILELDKTLEQLETTRRASIADEKKRDYDSTAVLFERTKSISKEDLLKKESEFKVAAAERDIAAEQLRRRVIAAPFSGQVTELTLETGEACQAYEPLVRLVDTSRCYFISNLEAKAAARLKLGQTVKLEIETGAAPVTLNGKVVFISPVVDAASGLVKVRVVFDNADRKVRPGLAAKLILE